MRKFLQLLIGLSLVVLLGTRIHAASADQLTQTIADLEQKIAGLQTQKDSLSKQIALFDSQIKLTTLRIDDTKSKIALLDTELGQLSTEIDRLEQLKTQRLQLVLGRIPQSYKRATTSEFGWIFFSDNFSDLLSRVKYVRHVQQEDAATYKQLQLVQFDYNDRKDTREKKKAEQEALKQQLVQRTTQLAVQKSEKQALLIQTNSDESRYQQLLSAARAQLAGFANFSSAFGGGALSGQTKCDGWGCYYNQRDTQWANVLINGRNDCNGPCSVMRVGCLITSVAMMASHLGHKEILPVDIAISDPKNFSVGTAMLVKGAISVKGITINRTTVAGSLNPDLVKNGPVIVGIYYGQFGTHFVVVKSYVDGKYIMNDPYQENGGDTTFTDHYSLGSVFQVDRVSI